MDLAGGPVLRGGFHGRRCACDNDTTSLLPLTGHPQTARRSIDYTDGPDEAAINPAMPI